ncbi:hypothetical protein ABB37_01746 [Leptomonas pyrrhocoris]|uniref:Uncharacterized protein n=1 Tax=Leptomonas pyrrhocoris TaxID=157538 RepID=A0A0M9G9F7_LEPPY|nr:hypothetical protein ABB37_01746 [Leptomonas pyrrhocoris]KPA85447.1 hypothetical protein ABB37_01746 [Leptomonas pyrrhocoris]|eukprot:XP_015663886.1 hypothetical protein ABB37_01746 [Leptomonas pyrrhocoris]
MFLRSLVSWAYGYVKGVAKQYLYNETLGLAQEMLLADSISDAAELFIGAASKGGESFWMDFILVLSVLIIVLMMTTCVVRFSIWICIGIPLAARDLEQIRAGKKDYQIQAAREKEERKKRVENGEEEAFVPPEKDLQEVSELLAKMRQEQDKKPGEADKTKEQGKEVTFTPTSRRPAQNARATPASILRGFPEVDFMATSPGQKYFLVGCRSKRRTSLYPQSDATAFMERGKELQEKHFTDVNATVTTAVGLEQKAEIFAASFSADDARLVVGERFTDKFVCFTLSGRTNVSLVLLWSMKLPGHRLVSSVPRWAPLGTAGILSIVDAAAEVEAITRGPAETATAHKEKFKVGSALAWAVSDDRVAIGGAFLREPRLARVVQRPSSAGIALETYVVFPNPQKLRVTALAFVTPNAPEFNTRSYMIVFTENGVGTIYDLGSLASQNTPQAVCTFADTDFAEYRSNAPVRIITAVRGKAYHEVLRVALVRGSNVSVYEQRGKATDGVFQLIRITDIFDAQEGDMIRNAAFLQNGLGLATCGNADGRHVRMFTLPAEGKTA